MSKDERAISEWKAYANGIGFNERAQHIAPLRNDVRKTIEDAISKGGISPQHAKPHLENV